MKTSIKCVSLFIFILSLTLSYGCSLEEEEGLVGEGKVELTNFKSCDRLEEYFKQNAIKNMETMQYRGYGDGAAKGGVEMLEVADSTTSGGDAADGVPLEYSQTNVQEAGVDEADFVKTDVDFIYLLNGNNFFVIKSTPAEETRELSRYEIEGYPAEMYISRDHALIFSHVYVYDTEDVHILRGEGEVKVSVEAVMNEDEETDAKRVIGDIGLPGGYHDFLKLTVLDIAERNSPSLVREIYVEGHYQNSRMVDDVVYTVIYTYPGLPEVDIYPMSGGIEGEVGNTYEDGAVIEKEITEDYPTVEEDIDREDSNSYEDYTKELEKAIEETELSDWLPLYYEVNYLDGEAEVSEDTICPCEDFYQTPDSYGTGITSIISVDLKEPDKKQEDTAIISEQGIVYASPESLYIATVNYSWFSIEVSSSSEEVGKDFETTTLHKFDIAGDPGHARYAASGEVKGRVLNQFSMDEENGFFRIATTVDNTRSEEGGDGPSNYLFVLKEVDGMLEVVGEIADIALDESIYSARFLEDKGFIVTFERIDPLFTLDLSDPFNPLIVGELKVPGYSTYIHPIGEDHLLTIGMEVTEEGDWLRTGGVKLAIFSVKNFAEPELVKDLKIGERGSGSEALYNHKAFNYFPQKDILAIPMTRYEGDMDIMYDTDDMVGVEVDEDEEVAIEKYAYPVHAFSGLQVYHITIEEGFSLVGEVDHSDLIDAGEEYYYFNNNVRRSIIIGDHIYSISDKGLKVNPLSDLDLTTAEVSLPGTEMMYYGWR